MCARLVVGIGIAALLSVSCGGVTSPSDNKVENFSATLQEPSMPSMFHAFSVSNTGEYSIVIKRLAPASSVALAVTYGYDQGNNSCSPISANIGSLNSVVLSGPIYRGAYCVVVSDYLGAFTVPEMYTIAVSHP